MKSLRGGGTYVFVAVFAVAFIFGILKLSGFFGEDFLTIGNSHEELDSFEENEKKGIVFVGDIMLARSVERSLVSLPKDHAFLMMNELFRGKFVVGNFEASIPVVHVPTPNFTFKFSVTPKLLPILKEAGIGYLSLANNHAFDYGKDGYENTVRELEKSGIVPFGHPSSISSKSVTYIKLEDKTVAVIGISNLFTKLEKAEWEPVIMEAIEKSDLQVVYVHWGDEYEFVHNATDRELSKELINAGVDVIVGHHPHVVQDIWRYGDGVVFYSLGNFIFDQYWEDAVLNGLALNLQFEGNEGWTIEIVPVESKSVRLQPREMVKEERLVFLSNLAARSDPALADSIREGVISLQF